MARPGDPLAAVGGIVEALRTLGLEPVLVGGMALVVLGSRRVTRDFDFVIADPGERLASTVALLYDRGLELVSRLDDTGDVSSTITNRRVATSRLKLDRPASASFFNPKSGLRIDLLFDYPIPAATLAARATRTRIRSHLFHIASEPDLLQLKKLALAERDVPGDASDIAFLEGRRGGGSRD
ncbi:MAG: hypothetical protein R2862_03455 [Thermoanaerobaculia bacterium]